MARKLPDNLYSNQSKDTTYFKYKMPDGKWKSLGSNRALAIAAAKELNLHLYASHASLAQSVLPQGPTVADEVAYFIEHRLPVLGYAKGTLENYMHCLNAFVKKYAKRQVSSITVVELSKDMEDRTPAAASKYRQVLSHFFRVVMSRGHRPDNPAEITLPPIVKVERQRLTLEMFRWVHGHAEDWMKNLMDLALLTLQRRTDLLFLKAEDVRDGYLYVIQEKTKKYDTGYLAIKIGPALQAVLDRCEAYPMKGPTLVRRRPERYQPWKGQLHISQPSPDKVSKVFTQLIDQCPLTARMKPEQKPTFHEIRALGIKLYKDAGINPQHLAGHASERMTSNYDSRHEDIRWNRVEANLELPND